MDDGPASTRVVFTTQRKLVSVHLVVLATNLAFFSRFLTNLERISLELNLFSCSLKSRVPLSMSQLLWYGEELRDH